MPQPQKALSDAIEVAMKPNSVQFLLSTNPILLGNGPLMGLFLDHAGHSYDFFSIADETADSFLLTLNLVLVSILLHP